MRIVSLQYGSVLGGDRKVPLVSLKVEALTLGGSGTKEGGGLGSLCSSGLSLFLMRERGSGAGRCA